MRFTRKSISILLVISLFMMMMVTTAVQISALNSDDYRAWSHKDSRWSSTTMGSSTVGNGGAPTTAITKLAIQAGLRDAHEFDIGTMATLLTNNSGYSGSAIYWSAPTNASLNLFSSFEIKQDNGTYTSSSNYATLISYIKNGWHLVIQVKNSSGSSNYVAVDEKLTLASGSTVYIMDCLSNTANNTDIALAKRYSSYVRVIGYKGEASQNSSINADYRKWELNNTNWADTVLNGTNTMNNSVVGGGDLVLSSTKLAIQAGLWSDDTIGGVNSVNRAKAAIANFASGGVVDEWDDIKTAFGFNSFNSALMGSASDRTGTISSTLSSNVDALIDYLNQGYYLAIRVNSSVGWVAVDTEKTLAEGEIYIMRSTPDASKNADIKLSDYYDTMNRVAGFKSDGVQVTFSGNATFTASYTKDGNTTSFSSGSYVPDAAVVTINAVPKSGYTAADDWTISNDYSFSTTTASACTFTTDTSKSTTADIKYTPVAAVYSIEYSYGVNSASFDYTSIPSAASTGATVEMEILPKDNGSFVYELQVAARDSDNKEISVSRNGNIYSFTMPASDVTVTFTGQNVEDWRSWARNDERWRDKELAPSADNSYTVSSVGAAVLSLAKMVIQAGLQAPTTLTSQAYDVNDVVDALNAKGLITSSGGIIFNDNTDDALEFSTFHQFTKVDNSSVDIYETAANRKALVDNIKNGYHQLIRLYDSNKNSEWFIIDEEKTLAAAGDNTSVALSDIYIYRATAESENNANFTLQQLYDAKGLRYIYRNYAFTGGTTPSRKINFSINSDGAAVSDANKGSVAAEYTIDGESVSFESGKYVPSRSTVKLKYNAVQGYYSFVNWTSSDTAVTSLSSTESDNPKNFTINASDFTTGDVTADISCNINPEDYNIYYTNGEHFSYSNIKSTAGYGCAVSFAINPDSGYSVDASSIVFKNADDEVIEGLDAVKSNTTYTFTMPAQDVYISAAASSRSFDDFRAWGVADSRWSSKSIRTTSTAHTMGEAISGGSDAVMAFAKLLIQSGYPSQLKTDLTNVLYSETDSDNNASFMDKFITQAVKMRNTGKHSNVNLISSGGVLNNASTYSPTDETDKNAHPWTGEWGMATVAKNLSIIDTVSTSTYSDGATAGGSSSRTGKYMFTQLLGSSKSKMGESNFSLSRTVNGETNAYTKLLLDYLEGNHSRISTAVFPNSTADYIVNSYNYKFHIMLYVNNTIGWVAVDEAQSLNTGEIWVWASHGVNGNDTTQSNVFKLSTVSDTFVKAAAFKFQDASTFYGADKVEFTSTNATLGGSYSYMGHSYPNSGLYSSAMYVPHSATVTVKRTAIADNCAPSSSQTYGAWKSQGGTVVPASYDNTNLIYETAYQSLSGSRYIYDVQYVADTLPVVHVKFIGDANGSLNGARDSLSDAVDVYQGDSVQLTISPDANFEIDTLKIIKTDSSYNSLNPAVEEYLDNELSSVTFDSALTSGEESWFIVQAAFKGRGLRIIYNYNEYNPSLSGTHEYIEPEQGGTDAYLISKSYIKTVNSCDTSSINAIKSAVIANAPVLSNVYFNYNLDLNSFSCESSGSAYTASVTLIPNVKNYVVSVNGIRIDGSFHYQEQIALDASDYDVDTSNVVWTRVAESGKAGSANVCYDTVYSFRVTSDISLTVGENLGSRTSVDGTSVITPGYTEVNMVNNVEKCVQNFYVQDFFDSKNPKVYDSNGEVISGAGDISLIGAGVLFYAYDTDADKPSKAAFGGVEPTRESIYSTLNNNKNAFLSDATSQGNSFKNSNLSYSYIKASTDNGNILRYSAATSSYNYFFSPSINNNTAPENQKYVYRVYSFYVCSYTLDGNTYVMPVLSDSYAQAKLYYTTNTVEVPSGENASVEAIGLNGNGDAMSLLFGS